METIILRIDNLKKKKYPVLLLKWPDFEILAQAALKENLALPDKAKSFSAKEIFEEFAGAIDQEKESLPQIGEQLYALLTQGGIDAQINPDASPGRIILDIRPVELQKLPWELTICKRLPIFCHTKHPICRGNLHDGTLLQDHEWPLRILVVVGSEFEDKEVKAKEEIEGIVDALAKVESDVDLRVLKRPSRVKLLEHFYDTDVSFKPHILHFIGHGGVLASGDTYLKLHNEMTGEDEQWFADDILGDFCDQPNKPRLVVVNACRSSEIVQKGLWSVTNAFLDSGIPAVLGMQTNVTGQIAGALSRHFYAALANGYTLDEAVAHARSRIWQISANSIKRREWAVPFLKVRAHPGNIIRMGYGIEAEQRKRLQTMSDLKEVRHLVDRRDDRWDTWRQMVHSQSKIIAIVGDKR